MIRIHQAIFGDKEDGYGLLRATCSIDLARRIANATDIHEQTPDGLSWACSLRGFMLEENYLLMRTFVDLSPTVRQGRVFSHCLIIPVVQLREIDDLHAMLAYLPVDINKDADLTPIEYHHVFAKNAIASSRTSFLISKLINDDAELFAWVDYPGYEDAICTIWNNISGEIRQNLRFGIAFNPNESKGRPGIKILTIPARLISKWQGDSISIINSDDRLTPLNEAEKLLSGYKEGNDLYNFLRASEVVIKEVSDYLHLQKILKTAKELHTADLNSLLTLLNTLAFYRNKDRTSETLKEKIAHQINARLRNGTIKEIIRVRNEDFEQVVSTAALTDIVQTVEEKVIALVHESNEEIPDLLTNLVKPTIQEWWRISTKKGLKIFFAKWKSSFATLVLQLIDTESKAIADLIDDFVPRSVEEEGFINGLKNASSFKNYLSLLTWAYKRNWLSLYAFCLTKIEKVKEAFIKQLNADPLHKNLAGFELIAESYPFSNVFQAAKEIGNSFITAILSGLCLKKEANLKKADITDRYWQEVMVLLIDQHWNYWEDSGSAKKMLYTLLDTIICRNPFNEELLGKITRDVSADVYDYPKRAEIWGYLPLRDRADLLNHTALVFLELGQMSNYENLEGELKDALQNWEVIDFFVNKNRKAIHKVMPIFGALITQEAYVRDYIANYTEPITVTESVLLGQLIKRNNWASCATEVYYKSSYYPSFKDALSQCYELLNFYDRLSLSFSGLRKSIISESEWWKALKEVAIELFPEGPKEKKVWEEAGGKLHDLDLTGNGRQQWGSALKMIENGSLGIKKKNLLKAMLAEYGSNPHLRLLQQWLKNESK